MKPLHFHLLALFSTLLLLMVTISLLAQPPIRVKLWRPPPGKLAATDLWNVEVTSLQRTDVTIHLEGTVDEATDGRIVEGQCGAFMLKAGETRRITANNVPGGGRYTWVNKKYQEVILRTGSAGSGTYTICIHAKLESGEDVAQECITQVIAEDSRITLISPTDGQVLPAAGSPLFMWCGLRCKYCPPNCPASTLAVVEILGRQSAEEAIRTNPTWFAQSDIAGAQFQYPLGARKLEPGKRYAWQIKENGTLSEIYSFSVMEPTIDPGVPVKLTDCSPRKQAWLVGGNTIDDDVFYMGTCNEKPLAIGANGHEKIRVAVDGAVGVGTVTPRAIFDVRTQSEDNTIGAMVKDKSHRGLFVVPRVGPWGFNHNSLGGDVGLFWSGGTGTDGYNPQGGLVIGPWYETHAGMRISHTGNLSVKTNEVSTQSNSIYRTIIAQFLYEQDNNTDPLESPRLDVWGYFGKVNLNTHTFGNINLRATSSAGTGTDLSLGTGPAPNAIVIKGNTEDAGRVGIGTGEPKEHLQIGSEFTFHDGGSKVIARNFHYDGVDKRIIDGKSAAIYFGDGDLAFRVSSQGSTTDPIQWINAVQIENDGRVILGGSNAPPPTDPNNPRLDVLGTIRMHEGKVCMSGCDFVFEPTYSLIPLALRERSVLNNKHLPSIKTAVEMEKNGAFIGETATGLLHNLEEHELYLYDHNKKIDKLISRMDKLERENALLRSENELLKGAKGGQ